jgi:hypothetical protein
MKLTRLLPVLTAATVLACAASARATPSADIGGTVATLNINLTLTETIGGFLATEQKRVADFAKGITYPSAITYDTTFLPDQTPRSGILNPFGWDTSRGNHYVERVTQSTASGTLIVTATGAQALGKSRFTGATLLADLVSEDLIPASSGYRIVAVRFATDEDAPYDNGTYSTRINDGVYFFAEKGAKDPAPVFLGAENDVYDHDRILAFDSRETVQAGKYVDTFTGTPDGFAYKVLSESYNGLSLGEFTIRRPVSEGAYYEIRAGGVFNWRETFDARRAAYLPGAVTGTNLSGPARLYALIDTNDDTVPDTFSPTEGNVAIVTGSITLAAGQYQASMRRYLDRVPPVSPAQ